MDGHSFTLVGTDEAVGDAFGLPYLFQAVLTVGRHLKVSAASAEDLDELTAALTARRDELAQWDARFQVPVIVQTPDPEFTFRSVFHEWKEVSTEEMLRRGWHPAYLQAAAMLGH